MRNAHSAQDLPSGGAGGYTIDQLNHSASGKDVFFARKMQENASRCGGAAAASSRTLPRLSATALSGQWGCRPARAASTSASAPRPLLHRATAVAAEAAVAAAATRREAAPQRRAQRWPVPLVPCRDARCPAAHAAAAGRHVEHHVHGHQPADRGGQQCSERHRCDRQARPAGACCAALPTRHSGTAERAAAARAQEVSQRYQRGEFVESAATLMATGADLGLKGLSNLKGLLKTAVSQIDGYAGDGCAARCVARPQIGCDGTQCCALAFCCVQARRRRRRRRGASPAAAGVRAAGELPDRQRRGGGAQRRRQAAASGPRRRRLERLGRRRRRGRRLARARRASRGRQQGRQARRGRQAVGCGLCARVRRLAARGTDAQRIAGGGKAGTAGWAGWDAGDELPDEVWDADWGK
jgi:hypothetical protein